MKEIYFSDAEPKAALLIKEAACYKKYLEEHYTSQINQPVVALSLEYTPDNKINATMAKEYLGHILPVLRDNNICVLYVADAFYFKILTRVGKTEPYYGYVLDCALPGFDDFKVIYGVNYQALYHSPQLVPKLALSIRTINDYLQNQYVEIGTGLIHSGTYISTMDELKPMLVKLATYPMLTCDVETYGLKIDEATISTIAFAWDQHNGCVIDIDALDCINELKEFFNDYTGQLIFHNASFDVRCIIYHWYMANNLDTRSLVDALEIFFSKTQDTKLIVYLATNNTIKNQLSLKHNAFEFAGNYAQEDIDDIRKIPKQDLMEYNLVDCLATWYVYNKFYPMMVADQQEDVYLNLFLPALKNTTHMELCGMPLDMNVVNSLGDELDAIIDTHTKQLANSPYIKDLEWKLQIDKFVEANKKLKKKTKSIDEFDADFSASSGKQVARLLHEVLNLPVIETTKTGLPSTSAKTIKKLIDYLMTQYQVNEDDLK